ncbi:MAG: hypothetical protein OEZ29_03145 [Candidatus Bathyarchaeota archaeon]|nr:hypothetical protein [Candidatus Bathyarchaeota archaeon]
MNAYDKYDVALLIDERGKARWVDLLKEFVENGTDKHVSRQTLSNYLKELREDGIIAKTIDTKTLALLHIIRPIYKVTKTGRKRLQKISDKKEIYSFLDSAAPEEMEKLRKEVARLKRN